MVPSSATIPLDPRLHLIGDPFRAVVQTNVTFDSYSLGTSLHTNGHESSLTAVFAVLEASFKRGWAFGAVAK